LGKKTKGITMSKKHYIKFAKIIKKNNRYNQNKEYLIKDIVKYFKQENPRFDEKRFSEACK
jgi:hypothetical protein